MSPHVVVANGAAPPPSQEDVSTFVTTIFNAKTSAASIDAAYGLCELLLNSVGAAGLVQYGVAAEIKKAAADKKSGLRRESAQNLLGAIFERFPARQPASETVLLIQDGGLLSVALDALSDKGAVVREAAQYGIDALFANLSAEALVVGLMPALLRYLSKRTGKWQGTVAAYKLLQRMADKAQITLGSTKEESIEKDVLRDAMGTKLAALIPVVEEGMHDMKTEVEKQAGTTMTSLTSLLSNDDAIHGLSQTTFVAIEVLRQTVVVVENLTKLVHDPIEARTFLPKLKPGVKGVSDRASQPEVRELADRALAVIDKAMGEGQNVEERVGAQDIAARLDEQIRKHGGAATQSELYKLNHTYICEMVVEDVNHRHISRIAGRIGPYLAGFLRDATAPEAVASAVQEHFAAEDRRKHGEPEKEDDGEIEIVNADFSLAYGGMLLLSHTNLRLLKGHRYGLCGRNGAGKSTLMRSIAGGKLEGFPAGRPPNLLRRAQPGRGRRHQHPRVRVQGPRDRQGGSGTHLPGPRRVRLHRRSRGSSGAKVGSLSGGWKMKLALARAMLQKADVLLLDEPTNHLDVTNVKWLENYLKNNTEITSLIVSHDSGFLDEVTTDIYHYEPNKKLAHYRGNLEAFVKVRPEAKSYYTLSASNVQFKFPSPGLLTGVKSMTRAILKMTNVTYTYPGAPKPSLMDASCQLSLSSRIAIIGPNGAGKSTMIKLLTGEIIPTVGRVEKHPNLRIGYIKQHALEHVEMHLEKTPNQYLQWRYAHGDDREVHLKQTRILSDADRDQMNKFVELGDGKPAKQIEALIGRQKYKKTFQYEVKWRNMLPRHNSQVSRETLVELGFSKLVQEFDDYEAAREGLGYRDLQPSVISKHFEDRRPKIKVVLAAALWSKPHVLVLDEPTNFLDRDSLGGLAVAIRDFKGGVILISHNEEFVGALCSEQFHVNDGKVAYKGQSAVHSDRFEDSSRPDSGVPSTAVSSAAPSAAPSAVPSAVNSGTEDNSSPMSFKARKKKKGLTKKELKERVVRRRLREIAWLSSAPGTPKPVDTDDEE
ncbi:unnamed protein product [Parascedosporium putredinis]|uniref:ABC transporter domain-containing protein n=1 Tax=Parascedosporium putredinis TaxID=1442378 RepID=A0A9P1GVA3_9PEZI|nr:unnamed protein product [Parascedosporium putredinis]CAI7988327.1 unnamed protein product [Parascedosporium putredinis]